MAKRKRATTKATIERRLAEGRGGGTGCEYRPWLLVQDVPSSGSASRILGWTTGRGHHLFSRLERRYLMLLDWSELVRDVREQYPLLAVEETLAIAERLGVRHPADPHTKEPIVMTTEFLVSAWRAGRETLDARSVKQSAGKRSLQNGRALEKLEIERVYWAARGVDWGIVTEREIPAAEVANVAWVYAFRRECDLAPLTSTEIAQVRERLEDVIAARGSSEVRLANLGEDCDAALDLNSGSALAVVRHVIATKVWRVPMAEKLSPSKPVVVEIASRERVMESEEVPA